MRFFIKSLFSTLPECGWICPPTGQVRIYKLNLEFLCKTSGSGRPPPPPIWKNSDLTWFSYLRAALTKKCVLSLCLWLTKGEYHLLQDVANTSRTIPPPSDQVA